MHSRFFAAFVATCTLFVAAAVVTVARLAPPPPAVPGSLDRGMTLLPNGWKIEPAGGHLLVAAPPAQTQRSPL